MANQVSRTTTLILLTSLLLGTPALAAPQIAIDSRIEQKQVLVVDGKEQVRYLPTEATTPGSVLRFTLIYRNSGDEIARDVVLDNPVPKGTSYLNGSATTGSEVTTEFSIDGGKSYKKPAFLTYEITLPNGNRESRVASPEEYTHIRWQLKAVPAGGSGQVSFEALVK